MAGEDELDWSGGATQESAVEYDKLAHGFLELQVLSKEQQEFRLPFIHQEILLAEVAPAAFPNGFAWKAVLQGESVRLLDPDSDESRALAIGSMVELGGARIRLLDARRPPVGTLQGLSPPYVGRVWNLTDQQTWLGRKGKRLNHIEINHPTVSRTHATFLPDNQGTIEMLAESGGAATVVNGQGLQAGEKARLQHGTLICCGEMMFRFAVPVHSEQAESLLKMKTLGTFQVSLGGEQFAGEFRNDKAQHLLAALAVRWGEPCSVDWLLAQFWPDSATARGRKNLGYTLGQIREYFRIKDTDDDDLLLRSPSHVQINPQRLEEHDYTEIKKITETRQALSSRSTLERAIQLYGGPFLPDCYDDWAAVARQSLNRDFTETLMRSAAFFLEQGDFETLRIAVEKLLKLDPLNEKAASLLMEGALTAAKPEVAVSVYEQLKKDLAQDELEPSTEIMKIYYRASLGL